MNKETKTRQVKARRANTATIGTHYTITHIVRDPTENKAFGFCTADDGSEAYIPRHVIIREQITAADVGAGFRALSREAPPGFGDRDKRQISAPVKWDGEAELIEVEDDAEDVDFGAEVDELVERLEKMNELRLKAAVVQTRLKTASLEVAAAIEELNRIDNAHDELSEWLKENYPPEEE